MNRSVFTLFFIVGLSLSSLEAMQENKNNKNADTKSADTKKQPYYFHATAKLLFFGAVAKGDFKTVKEYLDNGVSVDTTNQYDVPALHIAISYRQADIVALLLERKAKVDITDKSGDTALHCAMQLSLTNTDLESNIVTLLLKHKANTKSTNKSGETALHRAVRIENPNIVALLLEYNADVTVIDNDGKTAFDYALTNPDILKLLEAARKFQESE